jgi:hypothetical protein
MDIALRSDEPQEGTTIAQFIEKTLNYKQN